MGAYCANLAGEFKRNSARDHFNRGGLPGFESRSGDNTLAFRLLLNLVELYRWARFCITDQVELETLSRWSHMGNSSTLCPHGNVENPKLAIGLNALMTAS